MKNQVRIVNCFLLTALTFLVYVWLAEKPNQNILRLTQNQSLTTSPQVSENSKKLLVTKVIDGDTIEIYGGVRVRYI